MTVMTKYFKKYIYSNIIQICFYSLAERCGALHVGDLLLAVNGKSINRMDVEQVTALIRAPPEARMVQLEVLPSLLYHRWVNELRSYGVTKLRSYEVAELLQGYID